MTYDTHWVTILLDISLNIITIKGNQNNMNTENDYLTKLVEIMEIDIKNMQCTGTDSQKIVMANILSKHLSIFEEVIKYEASKTERHMDYLFKLIEIVNIDVKSMQCSGTDNQKLIIASRLSKNIENLKKVIEHEVNMSHIDIIKSKLSVLEDNNFKTNIDCDFSKSRIKISIFHEIFAYNRFFKPNHIIEKEPINLTFTINREFLNRAEARIDKYIKLISKK